MDRIIQMIIFFLFFAIVFGAMNYFVFTRLFSFLSIQNNTILYSLIFFGTFSYIAFHSIEAANSTAISRLFYLIAASWIGVLFISTVILGMIEILRFFVPQIRYVEIIGIALIIILSTTASYNGARITKEYVDIPINGLEKEIKAVHLTDIHLGSIKDGKYLKTTIDKTIEEKPDIVFITGDLFDGTAEVKDETLALFNSIDAPIYFSMGNHEEYYGMDKVTEKLGKTKIKILNNNMTKKDGIQIIAVPYSDNGHTIKNLENMKYNKSLPTILLSHAPDNFPYAAENGIDLMLSGHTHGGQIFPFNLLVKLKYRMSKGLYQIGDSSLYVSTGVGLWGPPMRLGTRNQIIILNLKAQ